MSKKIVIIRNAAPYDFGGGERFPVFLAEVLGELDFSPTIISRSEKLISFAKEKNIKVFKGWWWKNQNWGGWRVFLFPIYIIWQITLFVYYLLFFIRLNPTVIHIQSKDDFVAATFAGKLLGKKVIWTDHADLKHIWKNIQIWYKNPTGKLVYVASLFANAITVVSKSEYTLVTSNLKYSSSIINKIHVIYNGVIDTASSFKKSPHNNIVYIVASRLVTDKGIGEVIDAFSKLSQKFKNVELHLLGDGPEADTFKLKAKFNKNIKFFGHQPNPLTQLAQSDIFVHPTYHEGFSVALVEASMLSLPIIATDVGGNVEIIKNNKTGILINPKDVSDLYNALELLYGDHLLRKQFGDSARKQYEIKFNFNHIIIDQFLPLYGDVK